MDKRRRGTHHRNMRVRFDVTPQLVLLFTLACVRRDAAVAPPSLGISGDHFVVDGQPKFLLFVSYYDAMRRGDAGADALDADFAFFRDTVDGVRMFVNWLAYDCAPAPDRDEATDTLFALDGLSEARWPSFQRVLAKASDYGLLVDVTFDRDAVHRHGGMSQAAYVRALVEVTRRLKGQYPNVYFDLQNEWDNKAAHAITEPELREAIAAVRQEDGSRLLTASGAFPSGAGLDFAAIHDPRDRHWFEQDHYRAHLVPGVPTHFQEPMSFSAFCPGQDKDNTPGRHVIAAASARKAGGAAWTFHTRTSFKMDGGYNGGASRFVDLASAAEKAELRGLRQR
jgi:hypothetical protein